MSALARFILPAAAGLVLLVLGIALLRAGDQYRGAGIEQQAHVDATEIVTSIQTQLLMLCWTHYIERSAQPL